MGTSVFIGKHDQETLDWLRGLLDDDGEYQKVIGAQRRDTDIAQSAILHVHIDLLIDRKHA